MKVKIKKEIHIAEIKERIDSALQHNDMGKVMLDREIAEQLSLLLGYIMDKNLIPKLDSSVAAGLNWLKDRKSEIEQLMTEKKKSSEDNKSETE